VAATPDLKVIFIILIITLNLHDPSLSGSGYNTRPNSKKKNEKAKIKKTYRKIKTNEEKEKKSESTRLTR